MKCQGVTAALRACVVRWAQPRGTASAARELIGPAVLDEPAGLAGLT